jgi:hypothetical protein
MNLNQITARIGELSAELLTLHKDLAFLVEGDISRQQSLRAIRSFRDFREGDKALLLNTNSHDMLSHEGEFSAGLIYTVIDRETPEYEGRYNVLIESQSGETACWVNYTILELVA